ncbi:serine O-acetyltransferase [Roseomonas elaeocarpi]|uniref:Serine acetyltransferase n=1 Tax=Roseomonas elaeocarpi TaxID=907779 RepID=A0ABV6JTP6_9PROT
MRSNCLAVVPGGSLLTTPTSQIWEQLRADAVEAAAGDALLAQPMAVAVLRHVSFAQALSHRLARKLADAELDAAALAGLGCETFLADPAIVAAATADLLAVRERDPACPDLLTPFLHFKGFLAIQAHRIAHALWSRGRRHLALTMQSRAAEVFAVDIHPAACLGRGILLDHGTGVVIGETAVVEDDVSLLQGVTLGGTGKDLGARHPRIRRGVLIGAGAKVLGPIEVGEGARIGAGSIVLQSVPPYSTAVGVPARIVGQHGFLPALTMDHMLHDAAGGAEAAARLAGGEDGAD